MTRPLSPAAQAVMDAAMGQDGEPIPVVIAAAIRALVDQVVPDESDLPPVPPEEAGCLAMSNRQWQRCNTRSKHLAIAAELEGHEK
jgi:hypothetical protein